MIMAGVFRQGTNQGRVAVSKTVSGRFRFFIRDAAIEATKQFDSPNAIPALKAAARATDNNSPAGSTQR